MSVELSDALSPLRKEYYGDVRSMAEDLAQECRSGEIEDRDALDERMWHDVDGSQWVIYTYRAQAVCLISDNDDAYAADFGTEGLVDDGRIQWERMAFAAMYRDLCEALALIEDFDPDDDDSWREDDEDDDSDA